MSLENKVVLVSGANKGIGAATVRELLAAGAGKIYACARRLESLPDFGDARIVPLQLDINDENSVQSALLAASDVDVLVNNAGTGTFSNFVTSPLEEIDRDIQTNYYGTLRMVRAFTPNMIERGSGSIVNVISIVGLAAASVLSGYSASKAALHSMTHSLRGSLRKHGITVIGIYPGPVDTDLARDVPMEKVTPEHAAKNIVLGIVNGETHIFPDPIALQIEHLWANDGRQLEQAMPAEG